MLQTRKRELFLVYLQQEYFYNSERGQDRGRRKIRPIGPEDVEQYLEVYLNAYPAFKSLDDECRQFYREKTIFDMTNDKEVDFFGLLRTRHTANSRPLTGQCDSIISMK